MPGFEDIFVTPGMPAPRGLLRPGNINLASRPVVRNTDGTTSTVRSMSFEENGREILVPTVSDDGRIMSNDEAITNYRKTGKHLGIFSGVPEANYYAERLHKDYESGAIKISPQKLKTSPIPRASQPLGFESILADAQTPSPEPALSFWDRLDKAYPKPPGASAPFLPWTERVGKTFTQQEYDTALGQYLPPLMKLGFSAGLAGLAGPAGISVPGLVFDLISSQIPEQKGGPLMAALARRPSGLVPSVTRAMFPSGYWAKPGGELVQLEDMARHWNIGSGKTLGQMLKEGHVRGRGANIEMHGFDVADPDALRNAVQEAVRHGPDVYVDTRTGSGVYDSSALADAAFDMRRVRPKQFWMKEE